MFIDLATATPAECEALAKALPGPHVWEYIPASVCGTDGAFGCRICGVAFWFGDDPQRGPCEPEPVVELPSGEIRLDGLPLDLFIAQHGRAEAERRIGESFSQLLDADVVATIDDAGTVHIAEATP
jgi:hypothetical protein